MSGSREVFNDQNFHQINNNVNSEDVNSEAQVVSPREHPELALSGLNLSPGSGLDLPSSRPLSSPSDPHSQVTSSTTVVSRIEREISAPPPSALPVASTACKHCGEFPVGDKGLCGCRHLKDMDSTLEQSFAVAGWVNGVGMAIGCGVTTTAAFMGMTESYQGITRTIGIALTAYAGTTANFKIFCLSEKGIGNAAVPALFADLIKEDHIGCDLFICTEDILNRKVSDIADSTYHFPVYILCDQGIYYKTNDEPITEKDCILSAKSKNIENDEEVENIEFKNQFNEYINKEKGKSGNQKAKNFHRTILPGEQKEITVLNPNHEPKELPLTWDQKLYSYFSNIFSLSTGFSFGALTWGMFLELPFFASIPYSSIIIGILTVTGMTGLMKRDFKTLITTEGKFKSVKTFVESYFSFDENLKLNTRKDGNPKPTWHLIADRILIPFAIVASVVGIYGIALASLGPLTTVLTGVATFMLGPVIIPPMIPFLICMVFNVIGQIPFTIRTGLNTADGIPYFVTETIPHFFMTTLPNFAKFCVESLANLINRPAIFLWDYFTKPAIKPPEKAEAPEVKQPLFTKADFINALQSLHWVGRGLWNAISNGALSAYGTATTGGSPPEAIFAFVTGTYNSFAAYVSGDMVYEGAEPPADTANIIKKLQGKGAVLARASATVASRATVSIVDNNRGNQPVPQSELSSPTIVESKSSISNVVPLSPTNPRSPTGSSVSNVQDQRRHSFSSFGFGSAMHGLDSEVHQPLTADKFSNEDSLNGRRRASKTAESLAHLSAQYGLLKPPVAMPTAIVVGKTTNPSPVSVHAPQHLQ